MKGSKFICSLSLRAQTHQLLDLTSLDLRPYSGALAHTAYYTLLVLSTHTLVVNNTMHTLVVTLYSVVDRTLVVDCLIYTLVVTTHLVEPILVVRELKV